MTAINPNTYIPIYTGILYADSYLRLSSEEEGEGESSSISNQRQIIKDYCDSHNIIIVKEFVDDGYSGANFNRPDFKEMLKHLKSGKANAVITKDLSRLGRDMAESSYYAENYFPENAIRYIAIGDDYDSEKDNPMAGFKFAINDYYVRDGSRKVKQVLASKRQHGEYCACPPFGYLKDPKNNTRLMPDPQTAPIVQKIFRLAYEGKSAHGIANILTRDGDITPLKYRVLYRDNFSEKGAVRVTDTWASTTVKRILQNIVYLGHTALGKTKKQSVRSDKKTPIPKDKWAITYNTHTPLIEPEIFDKAQEYLGMHSREWRDKDNARKNMFSGIVFCENCGAAMCSGGGAYHGEREKFWYLVCNKITHRDPKKKCKHGARIRYLDLVEIVKNELNFLISLSKDDINEIAQKSHSECIGNSDIYNSIEGRKIFIDKRLIEIDSIIMKLYRDNYAGIIDDDRLNRMIQSLNEESRKLKNEQEAINRKEAENTEIKTAYEDFIALARKYSQIDVLTPEIIRTFIERIEIGEKIVSNGFQVATHNTVPFKQSIKIYYRFIGDVSQNHTHYWNQSQNAKIKTKVDSEHLHWNAS